MAFKKFLKIGLTGGIGSGKSFVAKSLESLGFVWIDADQIAKQARNLPQVQNQIQSLFQTLEVSQIREKIQNNPELKTELEKILHPKIQTLSQIRFQEIKANSATDPSIAGLIYEASLLIEAGRTQDFDCIISVNADLQTRIKRIQLRNPNLSLDEIQAWIRSQNDDHYRNQHAHFILENSDGATASELSAKVRDFLSLHQV